METYLSSVIWLLFFPLVIVVAFQLVKFALKEFEKRYGNGE